MRWTPSERAGRNFRDARTGGSARTRAGGRGGRSAPAVGVGGLGVIGVILALLFGGSIFGNPEGTSSGAALEGVGGTTSAPTTALDGVEEQWFNFLLVDVQDFWFEKFAASDIRYEEATLTLFDTPIRTGCGTAQAAKIGRAHV